MIEDLAKNFPIKTRQRLLFDEMTIRRTNPRPWQQKG
jgi:hypothetical protein